MKKIMFLFLHKIPSIMYLIFSIILLLIYLISLNFHVFILFLLSLFVTLFHYLIFHPILLFKPKEIVSKGKVLERENSNQILLVLDENYIKQTNLKSKFSSCVWDYVWLNTLEQEVGTFNVCINPNNLIRIIDKYPILILGRTRKLKQNVIKKIKRFVENGGLLILIFPSNPEICDMAGFIPLDKTQYIDIINLEKYKIPTYTKVKRVRLKKNTKTILKKGILPLIISKEIGKGEIISILFDYGLSLISLQQGKPDEDFKVINHKRGFYTLDTPNLVASEKLLCNFIPYADVLERYIISLIEERKPLIRLWYFPPEYNSAVIMSHDEESVGNKAIDIINRENVTSSYFIVPYSSISKNVIKKMKDTGLDLGIHWVKLNRRFLIFNQRDTLNVQIKKLEEKNTNKIISNRIHALDWGTEYTLPFQVLHANKIKIDSSYGPNPTISELYEFSKSNMKGYLFGTGLPFFPLDKNGLPLQVYEIPFQIQENFGNVKLNDMKRILKESMEKFHQITTVIYHPIFMERSKIHHKYFLKLSKPKRIWKTNFKEFYDWWIKRSSTKILRTNKKFIIKTSIKFKFFTRNQFLRINGKKIKGQPFKLNSLKYYFFTLSKGKHTINLI